MSAQYQDEDFTPIVIETDPDTDADEDDESRTTRGFSSASVRQRFVRNLFGILTIQLLSATVLIGVIIFVRPLAEWTRSNRKPLLLGSVFLLILLIILLTCCCGSLQRRKPGPRNALILLALTLTQGLFLGAWTTKYHEFFLLAAAQTVMSTLSIALFACQTKCKFRPMTGILLVFLVVLFQLSSCSVFLRSIFPLYSIMYASLWTFVICVGFICDTLRLINNSIKGRHDMTPHGYAYAALTISFDMFIIVVLLCLSYEVQN